MTLTYKKILVAVDGSKEAEWAFKKAMAAALRNDAELILAHVVDNRTFGTAEAFTVSMTESADLYAEELLNNYTNQALAAGVKNVIAEVAYGSPKIKIPKDIAKAHNIDLIVCGATGLNAVERFFIGSVSENITRYAPCDVLIVRTPEIE